VTIEGTAEAVAMVEIATAFAFLADPRNTQLWFATAPLVEPVSGPLFAGMTWRLAKTVETRRVTPLCMAVYQPPERFVWETRLPGPATNHSWELRLSPGTEAGTVSMSMTLRLKLGPVAQLSALMAPARLRRILTVRAQRALDRARAAMEAEQQVGRRRKPESRKRGGRPPGHGHKRH
jgi:hypothetical protein